MDERARRFLDDELTGFEKRQENLMGSDWRQAMALEEIAKQLIRIRYMIAESLNPLRPK